MKKLYIETYGCQMNVADSEVVASVMRMAGYETTEELSEADAVFLNTCSVRDNAEQKIYHRLEALEAERRQRIKRDKRIEKADQTLVQTTPTPPRSALPLGSAKNLGGEKDTLLFLKELQDFIDKRHEEMPEGSYTTKLFKDGVKRIAQKVGEEALEAVIEACTGTKEQLTYEASDMLYHLIVLLTAKGLRIEDLVEELHRRHDPNWDKQRREAKAKGQIK